MAKAIGLKTDNEKQDGSPEGDNLGTTGLKSDKRDANDEKIMVTSPDNKPGRQVAASLQTLNDNRNSPIEAYYEFPSSKTDQYDTYPKRVETIAHFLGNKDEVRG